MVPTLRNQAISIVLRGDFTPHIFQPYWFASNNLIKDNEAERAEIKTLEANIAQFTSDWLVVNINTSRFQISTEQEPFYEPLRDLAIGTFTLLEHTPLKALGINRNFIFDLQSEEKWHSLGHRLISKKDWDPIIDSPGMLNVTVQGERTDGKNGYIRVQTSPISSDEVKFGVFIEVNDHYTLAEEANPKVASNAVEILTQNWFNTLQMGNEIANQVIKFGNN